MEAKINYQLQMEREIAALRAAGKRPLLALHACCAPCSSAVLERLNEDFRIAVFFYNPNISPEAEFRHRAAEEERLAASMPLRDVRVFVADYDADAWRERVRGHEADPEGGERCRICFETRLQRTGEYAREIGADYFTTTLSISPLKDAALLNAIGARVAADVNVPYLFSDFKKKNGYKRSCELSAAYGLYRQNYCGCAFSRRESTDEGERT